MQRLRSLPSLGLLLGLAACGGGSASSSAFRPSQVSIGLTGSATAGECTALSFALTSSTGGAGSYTLSSSSTSMSFYSDSSCSNSIQSMNVTGEGRQSLYIKDTVAGTATVTAAGPLRGEAQITVNAGSADHFASGSAQQSVAYGASLGSISSLQLRDRYGNTVTSQIALRFFSPWGDFSQISTRLSTQAANAPPTLPAKLGYTQVRSRWTVAPATALPDAAGTGNTRFQLTVIGQGSGNGTFAAHATSAASANINYIRLFDFDQNGTLDMISGGMGDLYYHAGAGNGTFAAGVSLGACGGYIIDPVIADFNNDGKADIAVASANTNMCVTLGNGNGTFSAFATYPTAGNTWGIGVGDFNADGYLDIAVADQNADAARIFLNSGSGTFPTISSSPSVMTDPTRIAVADLNNDGILDLVVGHEANANLSVLRGNGNGTFQAASNLATTGVRTRGLAIGDLNNDSSPDILWVDYNNFNLCRRLNDGSGNLGASTCVGQASSPGSVMLGDFNSDGNLDAAVTAGGATFTRVHYGNGSGGLTAGTDFTTALYANSGDVGDINNDGRLDVIVPKYNTSDYAVLLGN